MKTLIKEVVGVLIMLAICICVFNFEAARAVEMSPEEASAAYWAEWNERHKYTHYQKPMK